jgi:putative transposase
MVEPAHDLVITKPRPMPEADRAIVRRLDRLHLEFPLCQLTDAARPAGRGGVQDRPSSCEDADEADWDRGALLPSANDDAGARPPDLPYLLRGMEIVRPNQVWAMDITYVPMEAASSIWPLCSTGSRRVLSWGVTITMEVAFWSRRWKMLWLVTASRMSSIPQFTGLAFTGMNLR